MNAALTPAFSSSCTPAIVVPIGARFVVTTGSQHESRMWATLLSVRGIALCTSREATSKIGASHSTSLPPPCRKALEQNTVLL